VITTSDLKVKDHGFASHLSYPSSVFRFFLSYYSKQEVLGRTNRLLSFQYKLSTWTQFETV
jgi:hypothetical protein